MSQTKAGARNNGAKPGERLGGRQKGSKNKKTAEKALIAQRIIQEHDARGIPLAKEVLEEFMFLFADIAREAKPAPAKPGHKTKSTEIFDKYARLAVDCASKLAPYQSPTFRAIVVSPPPEQPKKGDNVRRFSLTIFDGEKKIA